MSAQQTLASYIASKTRRDGDCLVWTSLDSHGYGRAYRNGPVLAHRLVYEAQVGPIPAGLHLDHLCRNRACVLVSHLEPVDSPTNSRRGRDARDRCRAGHEYTAENVRWEPRPPHPPVRRCKRCDSVKQLRYQERRGAR